MALLNCSKCGKEISPNSKFCSNCGNPLVSVIAEHEQDSQKTREKKTPRKKKKIILWSIIAGLAVYYFVYFGLPFLINTPSSLTEKLENTSWYTTPSSFVAMNSGVAFDAAYSIEFSDDGTAIMITYACYGQAGDYYKVEIVEEKTVSWSVEKSSTLVIGDSEYSFRFLREISSSKSWYFEDDNLVIGKTYYPRDKWGYSKFN